MPPGKPPNIKQFGTIIKDIGATNPGDLVAHYPMLLYKTLLQVKRVGCIIHHVPVPGDQIRFKRFRPDGLRPELDLLLVRTEIVEVAQAGCSATHKTASFRLEYAEYALHYLRIE